MASLAFLGLGEMGSRMAGRLLDAGHAVTVWNRTETAIDPLVMRGARKGATPKEAASGADIVISMVRDDAASGAVWCEPATGAFSGMRPGAVGVECSTVSPGHVRHLHEVADKGGMRFADAPLAGSRPQAEAGQLIFLAGCDGEVLRELEPVLLSMGSAVHHAGGAGAGSVLKLMVNSLFGIQLGAVAELIGFARRNGISPEAAISIMSETPVMSPIAAHSAAAMLAGQFSPMFPIDLVVKDFGLVTGTGNPHLLPMAGVAGTVFRKAAEAGFGGDNITGIVQLYGDRADASKPA